MEVGFGRGNRLEHSGLVAGSRDSGDEIQFETLGSRWPSVRNLGVSLCAHVGFAWVLATISLPVPQHPEQAHHVSSTAIQIGDRLYYCCENRSAGGC